MTVTSLYARQLAAKLASQRAAAAALLEELFESAHVENHSMDVAERSRIAAGLAMVVDAYDRILANPVDPSP